MGSILKANGDDVKTVQELLRHANSRITLDVHIQAVSATKREAQSKVVRMIIPGVGQTSEEEYPQASAFTASTLESESSVQTVSWKLQRRIVRF